MTALPNGTADHSRSQGCPARRGGDHADDPTGFRAQG